MAAIVHRFHAKNYVQVGNFAKYLGYVWASREDRRSLAN